MKVYGSGFCSSWLYCSYVARCCDLTALYLGSKLRSYVKRTSSDVSGCPSLNVTSLRRLNVNVSPSDEILGGPFAMRPTSLPLASNARSGSWIRLMTYELVVSFDSTELNVFGSLIVAATSVPPFLGVRLVVVAGWLPHAARASAPPAANAANAAAAPMPRRKSR